MPREERDTDEDERERTKEWEPTDEKTRTPPKSRHARPRGRRDREAKEPVTGRRGDGNRDTVPPLARGEQGHGDEEDLEPEEPRLDRELRDREPKE